MGLNTGLSLDEVSINGTLLMLVMDEVDDEDEELPDEDEFAIGGGFAGFPFALDVTGFVEELLGSFSCDDDCGGWVFRSSNGDVWGLCTFSPRVSVKLLLNAWIDDSAKLKSLS